MTYNPTRQREYNKRAQAKRRSTVLEVTEEGSRLSETLWYKSPKNEKEMAYLAAIDILDEHPRLNDYELAVKLPFVHGIEAKTSLVRQWKEEGLIK